jgi:hypothetical protein
VFGTLVSFSRVRFSFDHFTMNFMKLFAFGVRALKEKK